MSAASDEFNRQWLQGWPRVVAKAWQDEAFAAELKADPSSVLQAEGLPMLANVEVRVHDGDEGTPHMTLYIPSAPDTTGADVEGDGGTEASATQTSCCC